MLTKVPAAVASLWLPGNARGDLLGRCVFKTTSVGTATVGTQANTRVTQPVCHTQDFPFRGTLAQVTNTGASWRGSLAGHGSFDILGTGGP